LYLLVFEKNLSFFSSELTFSLPPFFFVVIVVFTTPPSEAVPSLCGVLLTHRAGSLFFLLTREDYT